MTNPFVYELASVANAVARVRPGSPDGAYALPWYLVLGDPGSGRTTAIKSMQMTWPSGDAALQTGVPQPLCTYWLAGEAVFIEPEARVLGPSREPGQLETLARELHEKRPREPVDGVLLVVNLAELADADERGVEAYGNRLRGYLVEAGRSFQSDVPVYVVATRYDTLWGFAEVFQWAPERRNEEPWGFALPGDTPSQKAVAAIELELDGLSARFEAFCLAKLSGDDPAENRTRAFQHLAEVRALMGKLRELFRIVAMANAYERAPWIRAMIIGSAVPGVGDRLRAGVARFSNMGLAIGPEMPRSARPGGLPIHAFMRTVVLPERDIVPTRVRWRDDRLTLACALMALLLWVGATIAGVAFAIAG